MEKVQDSWIRADEGLGNWFHISGYPKGGRRAGTQPSSDLVGGVKLHALGGGSNRGCDWSQFFLT